VVNSQKPSKYERLKGYFGRRPARTETMMSRLHYEGGFIPILNVDDTEARREEIKIVLAECEEALFDENKQRDIVKKVYALYFSAGNPWYRGLNNRELAGKVSMFLDNFKDVGMLDPFIPDLFEEAQFLLSLSWQALDVTNTPAIFIESKPVVLANTKGSSPDSQVDLTGMYELQEEVERLKREKK